MIISFFSSCISLELLTVYLSTSSAGGGLQMLVSGLVSDFSAQSAARAALGAGAIVLETFSADDGLEDYQRIEKIRQLVVFFQH